MDDFLSTLKRARLNFTLCFPPFCYAKLTVYQLPKIPSEKNKWDEQFLRNIKSVCVRLDPILLSHDAQNLRHHRPDL